MQLFIVIRRYINNNELFFTLLSGSAPTTFLSLYFDKLPVLKLSPGQVLASGNFSTNSTHCKRQQPSGQTSFMHWFTQCIFSMYLNLTNKLRRKSHEFSNMTFMKSGLFIFFTSFAVRKNSC